MITTTAPCGVKPRSKKSQIGKPQVIPRCISQLDDTALTGWEHSRLDRRLWKTKQNKTKKNKKKKVAPHVTNRILIPFT